MIKWTRLQLNALPVIAIEADKAIQTLNNLIQKINLNALHSDIEEFNYLRNSILNRIEALDRFYQQNYLDSTISIFHMIKLKLKKAIFKVQNIYNDTISIQLMHPATNIQIQNIPKIGQSMFQKQHQTQKKFPKTNNVKIQIKPKYKSRSKTKLQNKDNILKLLDTSRRQQDDTNLMEQIYIQKPQFQNHSFQLNHGEQYQPLFKSDSPIQNQQKNKQIKNIARKSPQKQDIKNKSISPFTKRQNKNPPNLNQNTKYSPRNKINPTNNNQIKNKPTHKQTFSTLNNNNSYNYTQKQNAIKVTNKNQVIPQKKNITLKMKTEGQQIRISEQQQTKQDVGQFRFTIKMTKQQYANLLKMKEELNKNKYKK